MFVSYNPLDKNKFIKVPDAWKNQIDDYYSKLAESPTPLDSNKYIKMPDAWKNNQDDDLASLHSLISEIEDNDETDDYDINDYDDEYDEDVDDDEEDEDEDDGDGNYHHSQLSNYKTVSKVNLSQPSFMHSFANKINYSNKKNIYKMQEVSTIIGKLFSSYTVNVMNNPVKFHNLLCDLLPKNSFEKEYNILRAVFYNLNIGSKLLVKHNATNTEKHIICNQIITSLIEDHGFNQDAAEFAINVVINAMGWAT